jgi:hypothetical protein
MEKYTHILPSPFHHEAHAVHLFRTGGRNIGQNRWQVFVPADKLSVV